MGDATFQDLARLMGLVTQRVIELEDELDRARETVPHVAQLLAAAKEAEGTFVELYGPRDEMPDDCEAAHVIDLLRDGIAGLEAAGGTG